MKLITLESNINYLDINWQDGTLESIRIIMIKALKYLPDTETTLLILAGDITRELHYSNVEDPNNPGNPFGSGQELFDNIRLRINAEV